ncbi:MAG: class I tRNA ligase family protein, partial [Candidatus Acidiferrales bacterium]
DTWFSSALWPFSTLGWPDDTEDLRTFYPTSLLISGYDILFFWDARMIMMGLHLAPGATEAQRIPFRRLYLHSLVRTAEGAKMSKTKGTGVDPLQLTQQYGTDALRYMLASMSAPGTDIALAEDRILGARAFANKIWNAARFLFLNLDKAQQEHSFNLEDIAGPNARADAPYLTGGDGDLINRWIFARLSAVIAEANKAFEEFRFHEACRHLYEFFWGDFCDWYIEWVKPYLTSNDERIASSAWKNIFVVLETSLRLLHPVMPFLTEELWQKIPQPAGAKSIALASYPGSTNVWHGVESLGQMQRLQEVVLAVRQLRAERKLDPRRRVSVVLSVDSPSYRSELMMHEDPLCRLAILSELKVVADRIPAGGKPARASDWFELIIEDIGESAEERVEAIARLDREIDRLERDVAAKTERLGDEEFLTRAPHTVVQNLRLTLVERALELKKLRDQRAQMS